MIIPNCDTSSPIKILALEPRLCYLLRTAAIVVRRWSFHGRSQCQRHGTRAEPSVPPSPVCRTHLIRSERLLLINIPAGMAVFRCNAETATDVMFASNMTPTSFANIPPISPRLSSSANSHNKKKPEGYIPRPPNAFILFRSDFIKGKRVPTDVETDHSNLSKVVGHTWRIMPEGEKAVWFEKARQEQVKHRMEHPDYTYAPLHKKQVAAKRKVRECGVRDEERCRTIAELVTAGIGGNELTAVLREFDRHHVPQIVTRFDEPVTASAYGSPSLSPKAPRSRKAKAPRRSSARASSSQPSSLPSASSSRHTSPSTTADFEAYHASCFESSPSPVELDTAPYMVPEPDHSFVSTILIMPTYDKLTNIRRIWTHSLSRLPPHLQHHHITRRARHRTAILRARSRSSRRARSRLTRRKKSTC